MYDVVIIGAGAAGLTAAIYARRAEKSVLVLEATTFGGQIINTLEIENYPGMYKVSGPDFSKALYEQAKDLGAEIEFEKVVSVVRQGKEFKIETEDDNYTARAVILATGSQYKKLGLDHEDELTGKGVSYCATCDGSFYRGEDVMVNGGGNTALYETEYLAGICSKVYLVHRRDEFRGDLSLVERVSKLENVEIVLNATVAEINAGEDGKVSSVKLAIKDGTTREVPVKALFVAIGHKPATEAFADLVEQDESGYVIAGEDCHTSTEGVFVAGDVRRKDLRQLVTATSDGAMAASEAVSYINAA
ncbi:thioredoxin-disulfide reductase [Candidatus Saccharibacteria bacterium]|nr:thioredoxin-disulfide reductase [Candidatus Saccharibacteria bacterium]